MYDHQRNKKPLTLIVTKGIPGSGKSTWAKDFVRKARGEWVRVNRDDIRTMLHIEPWGDAARAMEDTTTSLRDHAIKQALLAGKNVVVDECNAKSRTYNDMKKLAASLGRTITVIEKPFYVDLKTAVERDRNRTPSVGEGVVRSFFEKLGGTGFRHAVERSETIVAPSEGNTVEYDASLPDCIMCDLDGTLALFGDRNPYERDFENDEPNIPVVEVINKFKDSHAIVFCSGRPDKFRAQTEQFISDVFGDDFKYYLFMRKTGDMRKDSIVKEELFNANIRGRWNVLFVLDDRNQVVDKWREMGLKVFQVAPGNF